MTDGIVTPHSWKDFPKENDPMAIASILLIPLGPFVIFKGRSKLFKKIRIISPNPKVTMAK